MTRQNIAKVQHYVPRFILRRFVERKDQIWVYDKKYRKIFKTNIKNIAAESGFYDIVLDGTKLSIEPSLGQIESNISQILKRIIRNESIALPENERMALSDFFALQFVRTPQWRIMCNEMQHSMEKFLLKYGVDPDDVEDFSSSTPKQLKLSHLQQIHRYAEFAPHFFNKTWVLQKTTKSNPFWISDNPVSLQNMLDFGCMGNIGLAVAGIEIYFPISRNLTIGMWCQSHEEEISKGYQKYKALKKFAPVQVNALFKDPLFLEEVNQGLKTGTPIRSKKDSVINHNSLQVKYSSRFVFSSNDNFSLADDMLDAFPQLAEGPKLRVN